MHTDMLLMLQIHHNTKTWHSNITWKEILWPNNLSPLILKGWLQLRINWSNRLALSCNYAVCCVELFNKKEQGCKIGKEAFDDAIMDLDKVDDESYKYVAGYLADVTGIAQWWCRSFEITWSCGRQMKQRKTISDRIHENHRVWIRLPFFCIGLL